MYIVTAYLAPVSAFRPGTIHIRTNANYGRPLKPAFMLMARYDCFTSLGFHAPERNTFLQGFDFIHGHGVFSLCVLEHKGAIGKDKHIGIRLLYSPGIFGLIRVSTTYALF